MRFASFFVGSLLLVGCAAEDAGPVLLDGFEPGPVPENGIQVVLDPIRNLEPGSSHEICSYTTVTTDTVIDVRKLEGFQAESGHHIALFTTDVASPDPNPTHECTDADMVNLRMVAAVNQNMINEAPGDLVYRIPAGRTLVLQQHYINAGTAPVDSQAALNIYYADPGVTYTPSQGLAFVNTDLQLDPGVGSKDIHCVMQQDVKSWYAIPHMHKFGTSFSVEHTHAGVTETIFDLPLGEWEESYEFHPPEQRWDLADPEVFAAGDAIDVHCTWDNTTDNQLVFGNEMCVFFTQTIDDTGVGNIACNDGEWGDF
jgi:hypothetical protein